MEAVFGLLLMLLGVAHGVETHCDGRQDGAQCYGAVGGTVFIRLMDIIPPRFTLQKSRTRILRWKNKTVSIYVLKNRSSFDPSNGTFRISNLHKNDSDKYLLEIQNSNGVMVENRALHLSIQVFAATNTLNVEPTTVTDTTAEYLPVMAGVLSALVLLLVLGVFVFRRKKKTSAKEEEDEEELTYTDVRVVQRRHIQQRDEGEVEYGQVRISE
uniref:uncharacterized protein LOC122778444 n=1 Tax=Solea senegalensis TaxID=28829 RepID=UPI001CD8BACD|nr:uncharacterized protein LOC122778444 [Solea senegalensis]